MEKLKQIQFFIIFVIVGIIMISWYVHNTQVKHELVCYSNKTIIYNGTVRGLTTHGVYTFIDIKTGKRLKIKGEVNCLYDK